MGSRGETLLKVDGVSVLYGQGSVQHRACSNISFSIQNGEAVGLLGESGSGKSTLARAILGLIPRCASVSGSVRLGEKELTAAPERELRHIRGSRLALISQDPALSLNPVLTVGVQVDEVLRSHAKLSSVKRRALVIETLRSVGFADPVGISRRYPHELSGGERQRAVVAQAIACRPALLIADEATSKLDPHLKRELLELLDTLRAEQGMALLLISHEPAMIASYTQRLLVMYSGEIVESGATSAVFRQPLHPYTQALVKLAREQSAIRPDDRARRFTAIAGEPGPVPKSNCCYFEGRCDQRMPECAERHPIVTMQTEREVLCLKYE